MQTIVRALYTFFIFFLSFFASMVIAQPTADVDALVQENLRLAVLKEVEGDIRTASDYLNKAALLESDRKNYEKAIVYYEKSLILNEKINNQAGIAGLNSNLAMHYNDIGQYQKALGYFQKALFVRKERKEREGIFDAMFNIAMVQKNLNQLDEAVASLEQSLAFSQEQYDFKKMRLCYGTLYEIYEKNGDAKKMAHYFEFYQAFNDKIHNKEKNKLQGDVREAKLKALETDLENKITLLKKETEIKNKDQQIAQDINDKQTLFEKLTEKQKVVQLLEQDKQISSQKEALQEAELNKEKHINELAKRDIQYQRNLLLYGMLALLVMVGLLVFVVIENTARRRTNAILKQKQTDLAQANRVKDKMFSIIAHDLRAPFNGIKGLLVLLENGLLDAEEQKYMLQQLQVTTDSTLETLENLLRWATGQIQGINPNPTNLDLNFIAENSLHLLAEPARQKEVALINLLPVCASVVSDADHLDIIIRNLLSNAVKFTPKGGKVSIYAIQDNNTWCITVEDSGVGIPADKVGLLFNPDTQFSTRGTNNEKGTGLGLLLVKELVEKNNGTVGVKSEVGKGTTFCITLPASPILPAPSV